MKPGLPLAQLRHSWDRAAVYLPVLTMGLLALGSYWILRSTPEPQAPAAQRPASHEPDYFMRSFSVRSHDAAGTLLSELSGSEVRHYPDNDAIEIDQARLLSINSSGYTRAEARRLNTDTRQSQYLLEGAVTVERHGGAGKAGPETSMHFAGEQLRVQGDGQRIDSELPVELTRNGNRATAQTLRYDNRTRVAELQGRVRAQLSAR